MARMHKGPGAPGEKAKDFKSALKRLFKELGKFKILICISLILAIASSILSICTPNILSDLTDTISKGLVVNTKNVEILTEKIKESVSLDKINEIIDINFSHNEIKKLLNSDINNDDKKVIDSILSMYSKEKIVASLSNLSLESFSKLVKD